MLCCAVQCYAMVFLPLAPVESLPSVEDMLLEHVGLFGHVLFWRGSSYDGLDIFK